MSKEDSSQLTYGLHAERRQDRSSSVNPGIPKFGLQPRSNPRESGFTIAFLKHQRTDLPKLH